MSAEKIPPMPLLLWVPDDLRFRLIERVLKPVTPVRRSPGLPTAQRLRECSLVVVDLADVGPAGFARLTEVLRSEKTGCRPVVLARGKSPETWRHLLAPGLVSNILAHDMPLATRELFTTVRKLLGPDIFGLDKYFAAGTKPVEWSLTHSDRLGSVLEEVDAYVKTLSIHPRLSTQMVSVADEFLTNGLYNAPVDETGLHLYRALPRGAPVELPPERALRVLLMCDGETLGLSVEDRYGSLHGDTVVDYLSKCFASGGAQVEYKAGGAGLGFYCVFEWLNQFAINILPRHRTEMIGLMTISGSYKTFLASNKSFNLFVSSP